MRYLVFILLFTACQRTPEVDCKQYHTGTYTFSDTAGNTYTVRRTKDRQFEDAPDSDTTSVYAVEWINDCSYRLKLLEGSYADRRFYGDKVMTVTITSGNKDSYQFVARMEDMKGGEIKGKLDRKK